MSRIKSSNKLVEFLSLLFKTRKTFHPFMEKAVTIILSISLSFWPQELQPIFDKITGKGAVQSSLTVSQINSLANGGDQKALELLIKVSSNIDSYSDSTIIAAFQKILEITGSVWQLPEMVKPKVLKEILEKWATSPSPHLRKSSCRMALKSGLIEMTPAIERLTQDSDYDVKLECTGVLLNLLTAQISLSPDDENKIKILLASNYNEIRETVLSNLAFVKLKDPFKLIVPFLTSDFPVTRKVALHTGAIIAPDKILPHIISAANDKDPQIRLNAILALSKIRKKNAFDTLLKLFTLSNDIKDKQAMLRAMADICFPDSAKFLISQIYTPSLEDTASYGLIKCHKGIEKSIAEILTQTNNKNVLFNLLNVIEKDPSPEYINALESITGKFESSKQTIINILSKIKSRDALITLLSFLKSPDESLKLYALEGINEYFERFGIDEIVLDPVLNLLFDKSPKIRKEALKSIIKWKIKIPSPFIKKLLESQIESQRAMSAYLSLLSGNHEPEVYRIIMEGITSADKEVKTTCLNALLNQKINCDALKLAMPLYSIYIKNKIGKADADTGLFILTGVILRSCNSPELKNLLEELLFSSNDETSAKAVIAMIIASRPEMIDTVAKFLSSSQNHKMAREISTRLWMVENHLAMKILDVLTTHPDPLTKSGILLSITHAQNVPPDKTKKLVLKMLEEEAEIVRVNAINAITASTKFSPIDRIKICKSLEKIKSENEIIAALSMIKRTGIICEGMEEKLARFLLGNSNNKYIVKAGLFALEKLLDDSEKKTKLAMDEKLKLAVYLCYRSNPDSENKQICSEILSNLYNLNPIILEETKSAAVYMVPQKMKKSGIIEKNRDDFDEVFNSGLPFEYRINQLENYPPFFPLYIINSKMEVYLTFKSFLTFSYPLINYDKNEIYSYIDPF